MNSVTQTLAEILDAAEATVLVVRDKTYRVDDPNLPVKAGVTYVKNELKKLLKEEE